MKAIIAIDIGEKNVQRLREGFPALEFCFPQDRDALFREIGDSEILFAKGVPPELWERARKLRWYQAGMAGVDRVIPQLDRLPDLAVTNASGAHGEAISDLILAMMLSFSTGLHYLERRLGGVCSPVELEGIRNRKFNLRGQTLCIVGLGDIGGALASKAAVSGMRTIGVSRTGTRSGLVEAHYLAEDLHRALPQADHVALCFPLTAETRSIVGAVEIALMKRGAYIYNVGRGGSLDHAALIEALKSGYLAGAGLDVTAPEPLPADSPLRAMDMVILTEHTSGSSVNNADLIAGIFQENLARFLSGAALKNVVIRNRGY
jgi:phosphoglycerate dehydrogenase-like enzyme